MFGISSLLVLAHCSILGLARLLPLLPPANETVPGLVIPVNATPGLADDWLPGFEIRLNWASNYPMKPEDAYLCAIGFTYDLASAGWEETIPRGDDLASKRVNLIGIAAASVARHGDRNQLQNKHVILGLYKMMTNMARMNKFCLTTAALNLDSRVIGQMAIGKREDGDLAGGDGANFTIGEKTYIRNVTESRSLTDGGRIVDPEDGDFVISYTLRGVPITCQVLLEAALNGMAQSAYKADDDRCGDFAGFSWSAEVTYTVNSVPPGTARRVLAYILVRTALKLLPARLYEQGRCGEVDFVLIYGGEELGYGYIQISDFEKSNRVAVTS